MQDISFTVHTFKEGKTYVAYVPELDLSSCGSTKEEARKNIRDAVRGLILDRNQLDTCPLSESGARHNSTRL